jgi:hypothetical protein
MVEQAKRDPTMAEIVVALRETRREAGRVPPFTVVGGQLAGYSSVVPRSGDGAVTRGYDTPHGMDGPIDIAALRDAEIERLLAENARLNQRVVMLLKAVEHERARNDARAAIETDRAALVQDVRAAVEAEFRPFLLSLMRLLEKRRTDPPQPVHDTARAPPAETAPGPGPKTAVPEPNAGVRPSPGRVIPLTEQHASPVAGETAHAEPEAGPRVVPATVVALARKSATRVTQERPASPGAAPSDWIVDLIGRLGGSEDLPAADLNVLPPRLTLRQRIVRVRDALHL